MILPQILRRLFAATATLAVALGTAAVHAETVHVAVAANFTAPAKALAEVFARTMGHEAKLSFGATGAFYTQIKQGAPFDVLLAADDERPIRLEKEGDTVPGSRFTYATGQLVLWSAKPGVVDDQGAVLKGGNFNKIAIANPKNAPYGAAAVEAMDKLGLTAALQPKLVTGESIGQTYNFIATGNAELGFVALAQVLDGGKLKSGSMWVVPAKYHAPIIQDAVILKRAAGNPAAKAWMELLQKPQSKEFIRSYGYEVK
jgi:molybdate transport system substrate-binding protein